MMAQQQADDDPTEAAYAAAPHWGGTKWERWGSNLFKYQGCASDETMSVFFHIMSNSFIIPAQCYLAIQYCRAVGSMKP